ncbi:MAG: hypoxanthine phosphoribosyltransferase [Dehalococcoidia bacterium]|nr:hypoxanthine phosphoribosyltransferase [Dehalococcoidia bacterium]
MKGSRYRYHQAVREATEALNSSLPTKEVLKNIAQATAKELSASACSIVVLDSSQRQLVHGVWWGLSDSYLHKGVMDAERSLPELLEGKVVTVVDAATDTRVQYPEVAAREGIVSIMAVPLAIQGAIVGSVRVCTKERREFTTEDTDFLSTIAALCGVALDKSRLLQALKSRRRHGRASTQPAATTVSSQLTRPASFAHPSEEEFVHLLDFYGIEWLYEPRSFALRWEGERTTQMFTPDFYLPALDMYIELTTLKQSSVKEKNRKMRRLKELYPDVKIRLLYKRDYERLLAKYGYGPIADAKGQGVGKVLLSSQQIQRRVKALAVQLSQDYADRNPLLVGMLRGVFCFMADLVRNMSIPLDIDFMAISYYTSEEAAAVKITKDLEHNIANRHVILVEDIVDTGMTLNYILNYLKSRDPASLAVCTLLDKRVRRLVDVPLAYVGIEIPDEFVVGYGLDYQEKYRNLPFIALMEQEGSPAQPSGISASMKRRRRRQKKAPE